MQTKVLAAATDPTGQTLMRLAATGTTAVEKPKDTTVLGQVSDAAGKASDTVEKALADAGKYLKGLFSGDQKDGTTVAPAPAAAQPDPALAAAASR